jgi:hypothetical protein
MPELLGGGTLNPPGFGDQLVDVKVLPTRTTPKASSTPLQL